MRASIHPAAFDALENNRLRKQPNRNKHQRISNMSIVESRDELLNKKEIAQKLKISTRSVENFTRRGLIPYVMIGRCVRFCLSDVLETLKSRGQCNAVFKREVRHD